MKIKYLLVILVIFCRIQAERERIFKQPSSRSPKYYDKEKTCQKVNLWRFVVDSRGNPSKHLYGCMPPVEKINILKQEIENREQFKALFRELGKDSACQCMDWQIKDLIDALERVLGVEEAKIEEVDEEPEKSSSLVEAKNPKQEIES